MRTWRFVLLFAAAVTLAEPASAQQDQVAPSDQQQDGAGEAWYHQQVVGLAEVLGGVHFLQTLCHGAGDQQWRDRMRALINRAQQHADANSTPDYSDELADAFNRGYGEQQERYTDCNGSAQQAATELRARGLRISRGLAAQHAE